MAAGFATGVRAVLWDADGVLQHGPAGWRALVDTVDGPGFADAVLAAQGPALRGEQPLRDALRQVLRAWPRANVDVDVGFVDDSPANVEGARGVGLRAVRHDPASGAPALRAEVSALVSGALPS